MAQRAQRRPKTEISGPNEQNAELYGLDDDVRHSVLGNAGTLISFRLGPEDAAVVAREMQPTFDVLDLLNLPNHHFYIKLMIDGTPSRPFSARTLKPVSG